jgi:hypothetical protein
MMLLHEVYQRDDGLWQFGLCADAPGPFESRAFALQVAEGHPPAPAPIVKFRHFKVIREVLLDA